MRIRSIVKKLIPKGVFEKIEPLGHWGEAVLVNLAMGMPTRGLKVIGVTGTDGKTTTCTMIYQMLRESGVKASLLTTVSVDIADGKGERPSTVGLTTASVRQLLGMLKKCRQNGAEWVVLETSSHALAQHRVWAVPYEIAVMTNVTHEHLDYHKTFERYVAAKVKLFKQANHHRGLKTGVVNVDDPSARKFAGAIKNPVTYGTKDGELQAQNIQLRPDGSTYKAVIKDESYDIECRLPGDFNIYNSLAAVAVGRAVGLNKTDIERGIASLQSVAGRMERIEVGQPFNVIVDYAVTPEALKVVLTTVQSVTKGNVHLVFGATGDRDKDKRPIMGKIAAELADKVYLTDDETYTEAPEAIRQAVFAGIEQAGGKSKTTVIDDRLEAIKTALGSAKPGDTVLLTGIGHQNYRNMGGEKQEWDEREIARRSALTEE
ncbi:MAG: UDP-N-acetylmuramoyl-L-alanyl-D-glutamate--2,6-diaminopimelate ligase [Candidatus Saccharibacteria bacterium]|nr:UDP-N-acetylmuramoyl-L-alanyl-D-glutamate--2,6-diaminopimelate ligase [Candidatus Saccharibacteria bacterium]